MGLYEDDLSDMYGLSTNSGRTIEPVQYLLQEVVKQQMPEQVKDYADKTVESNKELNYEIHSKFNLFRARDPQTVGEGKPAVVGKKALFRFTQKK